MGDLNLLHFRSAPELISVCVWCLFMYHSPKITTIHFNWTEVCKWELTLQHQVCFQLTNALKAHSVRRHSFKAFNHIRRRGSRRTQALALVWDARTCDSISQLQFYTLLHYYFPQVRTKSYFENCSLNFCSFWWPKELQPWQTGVGVPNIALIFAHVADIHSSAPSRAKVFVSTLE